MAKTQYAYPKMDRASSYRDLLARRVEDMKLQGAILEIKEYTSRPPAKYVDKLDINPAALRRSDAVLVVILSNKKMVNAAYVTKEFYYTTVKVNDRMMADDIQYAVDNLCRPMEQYIEQRPTT